MKMATLYLATGAAVLWIKLVNSSHLIILRRKGADEDGGRASYYSSPPPPPSPALIKCLASRFYSAENNKLNNSRVTFMTGLVMEVGKNNVTEWSEGWK